MYKLEGFALLAFALLVQAAFAEEIYRSVDEQGNVTFSDTPPAGASAVERVILPPAPERRDPGHVEERNQKLLDAAAEAERKRLEKRREQKARVAAAEKRLEQAEADLAEARVIKDSDRQNLAGGKRRIHPDYFERLKQAEANVEDARKALRQTRGY